MGLNDQLLQAEQKLELKYNQFSLNVEVLKLIQVVQIFFKDWRTVSDATDMVEKAYNAIAKEQQHLEKRVKEVLQALSIAMDSTPELKMAYTALCNNQFMRPRKQLEELFNKLTKYVNRAVTERDILNSKLESVSQQIDRIGNGGAIGVPKKQIKLVSKLTEAASAKITAWNQLNGEINDEMDVIEEMIQDPAKLNMLENFAKPDESATNGQLSSSPLPSDEDFGAGQELLGEMDE